MVSEIDQKLSYVLYLNMISILIEDIRTLETSTTTQTHQEELVERVDYNYSSSSIVRKRNSYNSFVLFRFQQHLGDH